MIEKYEDDIIEAVRQNLGLEADDESKDEIIMEMDKSEVLDRVATWHGLIHYGDTIRYWVEQVYGIELED